MSQIEFLQKIIEMGNDKCFQYYELLDISKQHFISNNRVREQVHMLLLKEFPNEPFRVQKFERDGDPPVYKVKKCT